MFEVFKGAPFGGPENKTVYFCLKEDFGVMRKDSLLDLR